MLFHRAAGSLVAVAMGAVGGGVFTVEQDVPAITRVTARNGNNNFVGCVDFIFLLMIEMNASFSLSPGRGASLGAILQFYWSGNQCQPTKHEHHPLHDGFH
jgi:hypothetical protein